MTEEEAKKRYCPTARMLEAKMCKCMGSACMAWRGSVSREWEVEVNGEIQIWFQDPSKDYGLAQNEGVKFKELPVSVTGYCGLAGEP